MISNQMTLLEFIKELFGTDSDSIQLRDYFQRDPEAALAEHGLGHLSAEDVRDAMVLVQDNDTISFDRNYDTGADWSPAVDWGHGKHAAGHEGSHAEGGRDESTHVREHVSDNYVTNNYDDRDTIVDNSINQNIDTGGGDLDQNFENNSVTASGDGAVAAGNDIEDSTITTGNNNVVGDDNATVNGDDNTTAFGSGSAVRDVDADNGSAVTANGPASTDNSTNDSNNDTDTTTDSYNDTTTDTTDSHNTDSSTQIDTDTDVHTTTDIASHNDVDLNLG